jgi:hypothetical protein
MLSSASSAIKQAKGKVPYSLQGYRYNDRTYHDYSREELKQILNENIPTEDISGKFYY